MFRFVFTPMLLLASLSAQPIIPPSNLFRDPKFVRDFVGSYGFLSDVEPKVTADEQAVLGTIRELFDQSKFREAEAALARLHQGDRETDRSREGSPPRSARRWCSCWATSTSRPTGRRRRAARFWRPSAASRASAAPTPTSPTCISRRTRPMKPCRCCRRPSNWARTPRVSMAC